MLTRLRAYWKAGKKTAMVCNNVELGHWIEQNMCLSDTCAEVFGMQLLPFDLCELLDSFIRDDEEKTKTTLSWEWVHQRDGHSPAHYTNDKINARWPKLDHLMFTPKLTQGIDFNPTEPHFEIGFVSSSVNVVLPRRICQQLGRIRHWKTSKGEKTPIFLAVNEACRVKHLKSYGLQSIRQLMDKEEYLSNALIKINGLTQDAADRIAPKVTKPWKELYIRLAAEKQAFIKYPLASVKWWLEHDGNDICTKLPEVEKDIDWLNEE